MATAHCNPDVEHRADALSAIDHECRVCELVIGSEGTLYFDRGNEARIAHSQGAVHIGHTYLTDPVLLRLHIEQEWLIDATESPRKELIALLESWLCALKGGR